MILIYLKKHYFFFGGGGGGVSVTPLHIQMFCFSKFPDPPITGWSFCSPPCINLNIRPCKCKLNVSSRRSLLQSVDLCLIMIYEVRVVLFQCALFCMLSKVSARVSRLID